MVGVVSAILALEEVLVAVPQISNGVSDLIGLIKRGVSGGPDPTPEEIAAAQQRTKDGLAQLRRDVGEG